MQESETLRRFEYFQRDKELWSNLPEVLIEVVVVSEMLVLRRLREDS